MEPIAITVRGKGEWVLIHRCTGCDEIHLNRVAGDDRPAAPGPHRGAPAGPATVPARPARLDLNGHPIAPAGLPSALVSLPADGLAVLPSRAPRAADLFAPRYRTLTLGLVLTITLVAFEALATGTIMPLVAGDLGGFEYYGWTFSAFFLGTSSASS